MLTAGFMLKVHSELSSERERLSKIPISTLDEDSAMQCNTKHELDLA